MKRILLLLFASLFLVAPAQSLASGGVSPEPLLWREARASFYGKGSFVGYCGKRFVSERDLVVAHKSLPCGTRIYFRGKRGRVLSARVVDRGPYVPGRAFDLSWALARQLDLLSAGVGRVFWRR